MQSREIAKAWLQAFNEHHLEDLLKLYDDNAVHFSPKLKQRKPETNGLIKGTTALRAWWQDAFLRLPSLLYKEVSITCDEDRIFIEYRRIVPGEADMDVAELLQVKSGKIIFSKVYHGS